MHVSFVDRKCPFLSTLRAFEDLQVFWRATLNKALPTLVSSGVNLTKELVHTSGFVVCRKGEIICAFALETRDDDVRPDIDLSEIASHFSQVLTDSGVNKKKKLQSICCHRNRSTTLGSSWKFFRWAQAPPLTRPADLPTSPWQRVTIREVSCTLAWATGFPLPLQQPRSSVSSCTEEQAQLQACLCGIELWYDHSYMYFILVSEMESTQ